MPTQVRLGPIALEEYTIVRSGIRWHREAGSACRRGDVLGFCNIGFQRKSHGDRGLSIFAGEVRDLQIAIAAPVDGRFHPAPGLELGGFRDLLDGTHWRPDLVVATLEPDGESMQPDTLDALLYLVAGRRMTEVAEVRAGLATGWHSQTRVAHVGAEPVRGTLVSMGICEIEPVFRGQRHDYMDLMRSIPGPAQIVFVPDQLIVPSARSIIEQVSGPPDRLEALYANIRSDFAREEGMPSVESWFFAATLMRTMSASPATQDYDMLTRAGLARSAPPEAILLSARSELTMTLRHRESGCTLNFHGFRFRGVGSLFERWVRENCDLIRKSPARIQEDLEELVRTLRAQRPGMHILISNLTSTQGRDELQSYAQTEGVPPSVVAKDINLMVGDLARQHDLAVLDVDAIGAEYGLARHSPDGLHHGREMNQALRDELLQILAARRVPGFC